MKRFAFFAGLLVACAALGRADDLVSKAVGDRPATQILRTMLNPTPESQRLGDVTYVAGYEILGSALALPPDAAARLAGMVKAPDSFTEPPAEEKADPGTAYRPGVAFRFGTEKDAVYLLVCFSCDKVAVVPAGGQWIAGVRDVAQPARDVFLGVAKQMLPQDEAVQALPRVRSKNPVPPPAVPIPGNAPKPGDAPASGN